MKHRKGLFLTSFLVLPVGLYAVMVISPFLQAFYYSLTNWTGTNPNYKFVGLDNFKRLFSNELYSVYLLPALRHNAFLLIALPVIVIALSLFFAFMLNVGGRSKGNQIRGVGGSKFYKIVFFFPQVLSVTIVGVLWQAIFRSDSFGFLNSVISGVAGWFGGAPQPGGWLANPDLTLLLIMLVMIWSSVGFYLVYFSAAMSSIPTEIYEASMLDGANRIQTFFKVTLPLLFESVRTAWIYLGIIALDGFALVFVMTPEQGGPGHASEVLGGVMYHYFSSSKAAVACAVGVVLFFFTLSLVAVSLRATRRDQVEY